MKILKANMGNLWLIAAIVLAIIGLFYSKDFTQYLLFCLIMSELETIKRKIKKKKNKGEMK